MKLLNLSGRQDSNLRSPAPKAGALATTLRPVKPHLGVEPPGCELHESRRSARRTKNRPAVLADSMQQTSEQHPALETAPTAVKA